jgi:phosphatidylethanolamine-binding protein (PEBP) family uncharacterized protein
MLILAAISEHERQTKIIDDQKKQIQRLEIHLSRVEHDLDASRREANDVRHEIAQLRAEVSGLQQGSAAPYHGPAPPVQHSHGYAMQQSSEPQQQLPPLRNISGPEVMNGVQYQHDHRANGYRPTDRF